MLILYVRCTAIDPADPGILISMDGTLIYKSEGIICSLTTLLFTFDQLMSVAAILFFTNTSSPGQKHM